MPKSASSKTKVKHFQGSFLTVGEAAKRLGKSSMTVLRWCESGKLPAIATAYGAKTTYMIAPSSLEMFLAQSRVEQEVKHSQKQQEALRPHCEYISSWVRSMKRGTLSGKVFSDATVECYEYYTRTFFERHKVLSAKTLEAELLRIPSHQFAKREKVFKSLLCFGKLLIQKEALEEAFLADIKRLTPKRHLPPKRLVVSEEGLELLIKACENQFDRTIVILLANTGLRASEFCALKLKDIDMNKRVLTVRLAKGGKTRRVGLNDAAYQVLSCFLLERKTDNPEALLFINRNKKPLIANGLLMRLRRIGKLAGVQVSPHALRRAFVTINVNKGRSLVHLQHACGHSDITTTRSYCRETEEEVLAAMKDW